MSRNRQVWLEARRKGIGASDAAAILGENPWREPFEVWAEKTGRLTSVDLAEENSAVRAGQLLEPVVAKWFALDTGYVLQNPGKYRIQRHATIPHLTATLDRLIIGKARPVAVREDDEPQGDAPDVTSEGFERFEKPGVLEIKTTDSRHAEKWTDGPPLLYVIQCQHQLAVADLEWSIATVLIGGNRRQDHAVPRDSAFIAAMIPALNEFWECVVRDVAPPVGASDHVKRAIAAAYQVETAGKVIELEESFLRLDADLQEEKRQEKFHKERAQGIENQIKARMADAELAVLPSGVRYSLKTTSRAPYTVPASSWRQLRRSVPKEK